MRVVERLPDPDWHRKLIRSSKGTPKAAEVNAVVVLSDDPRWQNVLCWNEHSHSVEWCSPPPWPQADQAVHERGFWTAWQDHLLIQELERTLGISLRAGQVRAAVETVARRASYHPIKSYLDSIAWDGTGRLDAWLSEYLGATQPSEVYLRNVGRWVLISAVARAFAPGCKVDNMLILEGGQGDRKSSACRILGGEWYSEIDAAVLATTDKDTLLILRRNWIVEVGEFDGITGASSARLKSNVSRQEDSFRRPYGTDAEKIARGCILIGTTNAGEYLRDVTGGRRFWPVKVGRIGLEALARDRDQLWAEAVHLYRSGANWWPGHEDEGEVRDEQEARRQADAWETEIGSWLMSQPGREELTTAEVLRDALKIEPGKWQRRDEMRVGDALRAMGWVKGAQRRGAAGARLRPYVRASAPTTPTSQSASDGSANQLEQLAFPREPGQEG